MLFFLPLEKNCSKWMPFSLKFFGKRRLDVVAFLYAGSANFQSFAARKGRPLQIGVAPSF